MTIKAKHTPGPWYYPGHTVSTPSSCVGTIHENIGRGRPIAHVTGDQADYNARLIAAAPDMLAALLPLPTEWLKSGVLALGGGDEVRVQLTIVGTTYEAEISVGELRAAAAAIARASGAEG